MSDKTEQPNVSRLREEIDRVDQEILTLLNRRGDLAVEIGRCKEANGFSTWDPEREREILETLCRRSQGPLPHTSIRHIFQEVISACRALQQSIRVAFLGPEATFTHMAAIACFGSSCQYNPRPSILDIFQEVEMGKARFGVVPSENTTEGSVSVTLDQLIRSDVRICGEIILPISHVLMSAEKDLQAVTRVFSHPQALSQCSGWLMRNLPGRDLMETASTAAAAQMVVGQQGAAAVGSALTARNCGLNTLASDIQDNSQNLTRFLILGRETHPRTGRDKTSILFVTAHRPGSLHLALRPLAELDINLTRIESRPTRETPWEYVFFVDFEGHVQDQKVKRALKRLEADVEFLKVLGSYPASKSHPLAQACDEATI